MKFLSAQPPKKNVDQEVQNYLSNVYKEIQNLELAIPKTEVRTVPLSSSGTLLLVDKPLGCVILNSTGQNLTVEVRNDSLLLSGVEQQNANVLIYRR